MTDRSGTGMSASQRGSETRERLMDAALQTLREDGYAGTTARAIASRGGLNQALIFYHFRSVPNLLLEAFKRQSDEQVARYRAAAGEVGSLSDLVEIARALHEEDLQSGSITAVTQLMAAAASEPELGRSILSRFDEWILLVQEALDGALGEQGLAGTVSTREAAYAISALFLGIELMSRLDPEKSEAESVFDMMASMARVIEQLAPMLQPVAPTPITPDADPISGGHFNPKSTDA